MSGRSSSPNKSFTSRTLSRDALYAPLSSYINDTEEITDGTQNTNTPKRRSLGSYQTTGTKIPVSLRQSTLVDWIEKVSQHFHNSLFNSGSGKSLHKANIESRLLQRSLLLIGGGIHNPSNSSSMSTDVNRKKKRKLNWKKKRGERVVSNKKRKKILSIMKMQRTKNETCSQDVISNSNSAPSCVKSFNTRNPSCSSVIPSPQDALLQVNAMWSKYVNLITVQCIDELELANRVSNIEWAGAIVKVLKCPSLVNEDYVNNLNQSKDGITKRKNKKAKRSKKKMILGTDFIIIAETKNTWKMIPLKTVNSFATEVTHLDSPIKIENTDTSNHQMDLKNNDLQINEKTPPNAPFQNDDTIVVPKKNTQFAVNVNVSSNFVHHSCKGRNEITNGGQRSDNMYKESREVQLIIHGNED